MPRRFSVQQFANGLTVVMEFMPQTVSTAVGFMVRTGARDEPAKLDGVSHFLEHMMFKGTAKRGWLEINRDFDQMGARYNAFTGWEETCYYAWVLNEEVPQALELLSDMLSPALPENEFATEKKVILEEIARHLDMPEQVAFDEAMKITFAGHRLSSNVLGTPHTVGRMTREQMREYFNRRYVPANTTLFACGNINEQALLAQIEELWGARGGPHVNGNADAPSYHAGRRIVFRRNVARQHLVVMWPAVPVSNLRSIAAMLLGNILGDDNNSRLFWALKHTGLSEEAGGGYWGFSDAGLMAVYASCDPQNAGKVVAILRAEPARLKRGIRKEELQRAKNRARTSLVFLAETPFNRFRQLMQQWTMRRELLTAEEMLARINAVTLDGLHDLLGDYPLDTEGTTVGLGPLRQLRRATLRARRRTRKAAGGRKKPARGK
ncbi:MAG: pitrilysin family protein [Planctomycetota bacterium]|nr:pitrilysin family protein [Planctomycetota bacterium]